MTDDEPIDPSELDAQTLKQNQTRCGIVPGSIGKSIADR